MGEAKRPRRPWEPGLYRGPGGPVRLRRWSHGKSYGATLDGHGEGAVPVGPRRRRAGVAAAQRPVPDRHRHLPPPCYLDFFLDDGTPVGWNVLRRPEPGDRVEVDRRWYRVVSVRPGNAADGRVTEVVVCPDDR